VIHEDRDLFVVDKPAGISTHAPDTDRSDDVCSRVGEWLRARGEPDVYLGIHQRLDRDTSGVLLFTRRREANAAVAAEFEGRRVSKRYVAAVRKAPPGRDHGVLRHRLEQGAEGTMRALPDHAARGQQAVTRWRVLRRSGDRALLELSPETGRTHQIRAQLAAQGAPIEGDTRYGGAPAPRLFLHAAELSIRHPETRSIVTFRSALPAAFDRWLQGRDDVSLADRDAVERLLRQAADRRYGITRLPSTSAFRLANAEGDGLRGVSVDVYADYLVVSLSSPEAVAAREAILDAAYALGPTGVYVKVRPKDASHLEAARRQELAPGIAQRGMSAADSLVVHELGLPFEVHLGEGLSTGIFVDQRENRRRVRQMAKGLSVLNLFAYTGAFTVAAAAGGARATTSVDISAVATAWARRNLGTIGADPAVHRLVEADVLGWLRSYRGERFDLVIVDPPSFATTKKSVFSADSQYRELAALCAAVVAPGGRMLACTNHRGIVRAKFRRYLHEGARDAGRAVMQMKDLPDPADFPREPGREPALKSVLVTLA
jgi:23S rRNA (cytosine1962-C5)-methyltransferase